MKNYIANERGDWATSSAYVRYSIERSIHFGRMYTSGGAFKTREGDLYEALRCLGQGLHTLEDFGAHSNYCELALREMGYHNVFPHTGSSTQINLRGHHVFPLVTGTFGMVDFFHSVLGEASDHFTQTELNEMDNALGGAQASAASSNRLNVLSSLLGKVPGARNFITEAEELQRLSHLQEQRNRAVQSYAPDFGLSRDGLEQPAYSNLAQSTFVTQDPSISSGPPVSSQPTTSNQSSGLPGLPDFDPQKTIQQIYPILQYRDRVVRAISSVVEKIPGLETLIDKITETVTLFVFSLLAPFIRPIINAATKSMQTGSSGVVAASGKHQYEPWTDPYCTDPTHSLLSKDHFANMLNEPAGHVASAILRYVVPRIVYAWQHIDVPADQVVADCVSVFHHPALRNMNNEAHREMFEAVQHWARSQPGGGDHLNDILSAISVREGKNLRGDGNTHQHSHGGGGFPAIGGGSTPTLGGMSLPFQHHHQHHQQQHHHSNQPQQGSLFGISSDTLSQLSKLPIQIPGVSNLSNLSKMANLIPGGRSRDIFEDGSGPHRDVGEAYHEEYSDQHGELGVHLPPPSGYEQYHPLHENRADHEWKEYTAPSHGAHTYDYHSGAPGYDWDSTSH